MTFETMCKKKLESVNVTMPVAYKAYIDEASTMRVVESAYLLLGRPVGRADLCDFWLCVFEGFFEMEINLGRFAYESGFVFPPSGPCRRAFAYGWVRARNAALALNRTERN